MEKKQPKRPAPGQERKAIEDTAGELTEEQLDQVAGGKTDRPDGGLHYGDGGDGSASGGESGWKGKTGG